MNITYYNEKDIQYKSRVESQEWAESFHGYLVYRAGSTAKVQRVERKVGVAAAIVHPGGWGAVRILYSYHGNPDTMIGDIRAGTNFNSTVCHWSDRDDLHLVPAPQAIIRRLKGEDIGTLMGIVEKIKV